MKKIFKWVKEHLPRWFDISEPTPWYPPKKDSTPQKVLNDGRANSKWR